MSESIRELLGYGVAIVVAFIAIIPKLKEAYAARQQKKRETEVMATANKTEMTKILNDMVMDRVGFIQQQLKECEEDKEQLRIRIKAAEELGLQHEAQIKQLELTLMTLEISGTDDSDPRWLKDSQGRRVWQNQAYEDVTGMKFADCRHKTDQEIMEFYGQEAPASWQSGDKAVLETGCTIRAAELCCHVDHPDDPFVVLSTKRPWRVKSSDGNGGIIGTEGRCIRLSEYEKVRLDAVTLYPNLFEGEAYVGP